MFLKQNKELFDYVDQLVNQKEKVNIFNNIDISRTLTSYEKIIASLRDELDHLKKENYLLYERIHMNQSKYKEVSSSNGTTLELKNSTINSKGEVNTTTQPRLYQIIKKLQHDIHVDIHKQKILSLIALSDGRITTCGEEKSISIVSIDYVGKKWKQDIKMIKAHDDIITSLCELSKDRLVSSSDDKTIQIGA